MHYLHIYKKLPYLYLLQSEDRNKRLKHEPQPVQLVQFSSDFCDALVHFFKNLKNRKSLGKDETMGE